MNLVNITQLPAGTAKVISGKGTELGGRRPGSLLLTDLFPCLSLVLSFPSFLSQMISRAPSNADDADSIWLSISPYQLLVRDHIQLFPLWSMCLEAWSQWRWGPWPRPFSEWGCLMDRMFPNKPFCWRQFCLVKHVRSSPSRKLLWLGLIYGMFIWIRVLIKFGISKDYCWGSTALMKSTSCWHRGPSQGVMQVSVEFR